MAKAQDTPIFFTDEEKNWKAQHHTLRLGVGIAFPPFMWVEKENGQHLFKGMVSDYVDLLGEKLGMDMQIVFGISFDEALALGKVGRIDIFPCISRTPERSEFLLFTEPYLSYPLVIIKQEGTPIIAGVKDLEGKRFATVKHLVVYSRMINNYSHLNINYVFTKKVEENLEAVSLGRADACIINLGVASYYIQKKGLTNLRIAAPINWEGVQLSMGVRKDWPILQNILEKGLSSISQEEKDRISQKWIQAKYDPGVPIDKIWRWSFGIGLSVFVIFILIYAWNRRLRKEIFERQNAEKEIKRQKEKAERYLNLAGVIFVAIDRKGDVTLINRKGCEVLGYSASEIIGKNWFENYIPKWLRDDLIPISKQLLNGDIKPVKYYENPILVRNGEERLIAWHNTILKDEKGNVIGHLSAGEDITEKRQLEDYLKQAQRMESIGNLAGGIAHEFNNILSIIMGNNELIMEDLRQWSLSRKNTEAIRKAGLRARDIVKQLLTFSRQDDSIKKSIDIGATVKESVKLIRATTPTNIEIREKISPDCFPIFGDSTQINQILMNLCNNAIDALPISGGRIDIMLSNSAITQENGVSIKPHLQSGPYIKLSVSDNGSGIDAEILKRIFEPYFTTKDIGKGSGIGLAVVHGIVENHGGRIVCESAIGEGTIFTILIPAHEGPLVEEFEKPAILHGKGESILYVDDEPSIAELGRLNLESLGYEVFSTTDPDEALDLIKFEPSRFDLVISDMAMPNLPGDQLIAKILSINPQMPTIICSGYSSRMSEAKASEMGIKAFVMKPLDRSELAKKVRQILDTQLDNIE